MTDSPIGGVSMPGRIRQLPRNKVGYPIPFFVGVNTDTGELDFRITDVAKEIRCIRESLCWICGQTLNASATFVAGPMCTVNRVSAEPPSHEVCAVYAAKVCPFLTRPNMQRREHGLPEPKDGPAHKPGFVPRNPGVSALWTTRKWTLYAPPNQNGYIYRLGFPCTVRWYAEGRDATREEVVAAMESGMPTLLEHCETTTDKREMEANYKHVMSMMIPGTDYNGVLVRQPVTLR